MMRRHTLKWAEYRSAVLCLLNYSFCVSEIEIIYCIIVLQFCIISFIGAINGILIIARSLPEIGNERWGSDGEIMKNCWRISAREYFPSWRLFGGRLSAVISC